MKAKFISRDGLSLETEVALPPLMKIARPLFPKFLTDAITEQGTVPPIDLTLEHRFYDFTGFCDDVAIYKEQ